MSISVPDTKKIVSVDPPKAGYYKLNFEDGTSDLVPRVTGVLDILDKPGLKFWSANLEREYVIGKAVDTVVNWNEAKTLTDEAFEDALRSSLGEKKAHQMRLKEAGDIGTDLHEAIQRHLKGESNDDLEGPAYLAFSAWEEWANGVNLEPIHVEQRLGSRLIGAGGTLDCAARCFIPMFKNPNEDAGPFPCVFDWKSSKRSKSAKNGIYPPMLIQVSIYREMAIEMGLVSEDAWAAVVRLPKNLDDPCINEKKLDVEWIEPERATRYARVFLSILDVWNGMKLNFP